MFRMFRKMICLVSFVLVLVLVGNVSADVKWNDSTGDHLWSTPENWATGAVPTTADGYVRIFMVPGPTIIANEVVVVTGIHLGDDSSSEAGALTVDGGTLTLDGGSFNLGYKGSGTLNMNGGTITLTNILKIARDATAIGHVNLDGGIISTDDFLMREKAGSVGTMDVRAGTLIINGDMLSLVQGYIDDPNGWITAYDGNGTLQMDYDVTNEGQTTLTATHMLNPNPADGGLVEPGAVELGWTLPDPCVPGTPVTVDVYFGTSDNIGSAETPKIISQQNVTSVSVTTEPKKRYYWAVDTYIGSPADPVWGPIFSFFADNVPPQVDAGKDVVTWLADDGLRTKNLDATVTDDEAYTVQWIVVSEPAEGAAVIETATAEDTSITLTALGEYVLQLEAFDGEYTGSDTLTINVFSDHCEAAKSLPGWIAIPGDINLDCVVDQLDMDILNEHLLECNGLDCPDPNAL